MTDLEPDRRSVLLSSGAAVTVGLAGCLGGGGDGGDGDDGGDGGDGDDGGDGGGQSLDDHLEGANGYDGSVTDMTGQDTVEVENGAGDGVTFAPPAIEVDQGTTVKWVWVSSGHTVTSVGDNSFDDHASLEDEGFEHEATFDEAGEYLYQCDPHAAQGQKGAVIVN